MSQQPASPVDLKTIAAQAIQLSQQERLELISILQAYNQAEIDLDESSKKRSAKREAILQRRGIRGGRGSFEDKYINGYGPYRYLRYWYGKTHKSVYLGKVTHQTTRPETE